MLEMEDNGVLEQFWEEHRQFYATEGHCRSDSANRNLNPSSSGKGRRRLIRAKGIGSAAGGAATASAINNADNDGVVSSLTIKQMAGTLLFQVVASILAILVTLCGQFEKRKNLKRQASKLESSRKNTSDSEIPIIDGNVSSIHTQQLNSVQKQLLCLSNQLRELKRMQAPVGRFEITQSVSSGTLKIVEHEEELSFQTPCASVSNSEAYTVSSTSDDGTKCNNDLPGKRSLFIDYSV
jgi:hypothetical protein